MLLNINTSQSHQTTSEHSVIPERCRHLLGTMMVQHEKELRVIVHLAEL